MERVGDDGERVVGKWVGGDDGGCLMRDGEEGFGIERCRFWKKRYWKKRFWDVGRSDGAEQVFGRFVEEAEEEAEMGRIDVERGWGKEFIWSSLLS